LYRATDRKVKGVKCALVHGEKKAKAGMEISAKRQKASLNQSGYLHFQYTVFVLDSEVPRCRPQRSLNDLNAYQSIN
jgi:hypothetical protein